MARGISSVWEWKGKATPKESLPNQGNGHWPPRSLLGGHRWGGRQLSPIQMHCGGVWAWQCPGKVLWLVTGHHLWTAYRSGIMAGGPYDEHFIRDPIIVKWWRNSWKPINLWEKCNCWKHWEIHLEEGEILIFSRKARFSFKTCERITNAWGLILSLPFLLGFSET